MTDCVQGCSEGQMQCVGVDGPDQCCNWYLEDRCVVTCPGDMEGDTQLNTTYDCSKYSTIHGNLSIMDMSGQKVS